MMKAKPLTPPDLNSCQVDVHNGCGPFSIGGRSQYEQCTTEPKYIVYEIEPGEDGLKGSMSMCVKHKDIFINQYADKLDHYKFAEILSPR